MSGQIKAANKKCGQDKQSGADKARKTKPGEKRRLKPGWKAEQKLAMI